MFDLMQAIRNALGLDRKAPLTGDRERKAALRKLESQRHRLAIIADFDELNGIAREAAEDASEAGHQMADELRRTDR